MLSFAVFKDRRYYLWIALVALLLRVAWAIAVPVIPVSDSNAYDTFAQNLAQCGNYGWDCTTPSAYWPVGTSFVYSLLYRAFGHHYLPIVLLNLLLAIATIWLAMHLAETWFGRRSAAMTGILLACWVSQIQFTTVLASEQPFMLLTVAALALWLNQHMNLWVKAAIVGVILAGASYVRPTALMIPALLLFLHYVRTREIVRSLGAALVMIAVIGLLIAPWAIRNTQAFGQFVTISTNGGANLWMGNNPTSTGGYMDLPPAVEKLNEAQRDKYLKEQAVSHIKQQPLLFATRSIKRVVETYSRESIGVVWNEEGLVSRYGKWILTPLKVLNQLYWLPMLGLGVAGIVLLGKQSGWLMALTHPAVLLWGYFTAVHAIIVAQDRYHFPSIPLIAIFAGSMLIHLLDLRLKKRDVNQPIA
ncbi:glycosyltransferase family 39 protein [Leptolyngbya sp. FACHB-36]|uniref:glycosyltransferase family 39 protein n=1 Tax=Leptolyngbya sp. FACHB-36 TaxID=2692808 RepID=UPI0016817558|nr:glycosyltransferase family 39 protein [Leptolyngbya sp. FACHB-36]MBD2021873.1 glycosyltransferase family 39 protein [Leptolyngbya sp. FACHB-36]